MKVDLVSDGHIVYFLPAIELKIDDMLKPFRVNYILWIGWLKWKIRITWIGGKR